MTLSERDQLYVEHMLECIDRVERFSEKDRNRFMQLDIVQDAVVRNLQTLAEFRSLFLLSSVLWLLASGFWLLTSGFWLLVPGLPIRHLKP